MPSPSIDFKMVEQESKTPNLEILPSPRMSIKMKNKLKRRRSSPPSSRAVEQVLEGSKRKWSSSGGVLGRRVETLKGLIPYSHESIGVEGLFRETADYILALQLKVRVMQTMIDLLSNSGGD
uniref:Uncharacterized protein n=1 Tax=Kalanchoe fedtschenkoi TaxID=63787 RepID=A0A7N0VFX3_KALFE